MTTKQNKCRGCVHWEKTSRHYGECTKHFRMVGGGTFACENFSAKGLRKCRKCKGDKHSDDFYHDRTKKSGTHSWCRQCMSKDAVARNKRRNLRQRKDNTAQVVLHMPFWMAELIDEFKPEWAVFIGTSKLNRSDIIRAVVPAGIKATRDFIRTQHAGQADDVPRV